MTWTRRRVFKAAAAAAFAGLSPLPAAIAQNRSGLMRAPKQALVIGNSNYAQAPLKNPTNDARSMGEALKSTGFTVAVGLDLTQAQIREAIRTHIETVARTKAVGLFYFAGHGAQLAWRNYLIPVGAEIVNVDQLKERCVDVNTLLEGIRQAGNPMNLIILDACRDNPFGSSSRPDQKGLSQVDAPPGTLLAYATAPGNTASDGDGANGLYTEHLLREINVPDAKVEDMFKRVRLGVRRRSQGLQVPWESTSLEEDFWFIPPKEMRKLAEEEIRREFEEELALWGRIESSPQAGPLEDYLRRYPSGRFAELAQLRLDQVLSKQGEKKVEVVAAPQNPYTKGTSRIDTVYKIGDAVTLRTVDLYTKLVQRDMRWVVTDVTDKEVIYNDGVRINDLLGNPVRLGIGPLTWGPNQTVPTEFAVGKRWNTRFKLITRYGNPGVLDLDLRIVTREQITVPAGTFNAFRVEASGWVVGSGDLNVAWNSKAWYAPEEVRHYLAWEVFSRNSSGRRVIQYDRTELVSFEQA